MELDLSALNQVCSSLREIWAMADLLLNLNVDYSLNPQTLPAIGARLDDLAKDSLKLLDALGEDEQ
jgi:hypothetical protein